MTKRSGGRVLKKSNLDGWPTSKISHKTGCPIFATVSPSLSRGPRQLCGWGGKVGIRAKREPDLPHARNSAGTANHGHPFEVRAAVPEPIKKKLWQHNHLANHAKIIVQCAYVIVRPRL